MMKIGVCSSCRRGRYLSPSGVCEQCLKEGLAEAVNSDPWEMCEHPDLKEFDNYGDRWYS